PPRQLSLRGPKFQFAIHSARLASPRSRECVNIRRRIQLFRRAKALQHSDWERKKCTLRVVEGLAVASAAITVRTRASLLDEFRASCYVEFTQRGSYRL